MADKKPFRCPRCRHSDEERTPHRARCPRCGYQIVRPERDATIAPGRRRMAQVPF